MNENTATCPGCGEQLRASAKSEGFGWKTRLFCTSCDRGAFSRAKLDEDELRESPHDGPEAYALANARGEALSDRAPEESPPDWTDEHEAIPIGRTPASRRHDRIPSFRGDDYPLIAISGHDCPDCGSRLRIRLRAKTRGRTTELSGTFAFRFRCEAEDGCGRWTSSEETSPPYPEAHPRNATRWAAYAAGYADAHAAPSGLMCEE